MRKLAASLLMGAFVAVVSAQVDPNRVVVSINGEDVKGAEYYRRMEFLPGVGMRLGDRFAEFPPGFMTIERLITEKLVFQVAKQRGCLPTDAELQAEVDRVKAENPKFLDDWLASGRLMEDLLNQIKLQQAQFKLVTFGITITDQEVDNHYRTNPVMYTEPKRVKLRVIVVDTDAQKDVVDKALAAGTPFADVATKYSVDVTKVAGGEFGVIPIKNLAAEVQTALEGTPIMKTTVWVTNQGKSVKFLKEDVIPEKLLPLDDKLRNGIRRQLMLDRGNVKNDIAKVMADARRNAKIDIKQKEFADAYSKFIDNYLKQQAAKTGAGS